MKCFDANVAVELFEGSLPKSRAAAVEAHASGCTDCRRLLAALARADSQVGHNPTLPAGGDAHASLAPKDKVGRFVILDRIGSGGMGVVFAAYDPQLDRKVALKLLRMRPDSGTSPEDAQARLRREAQAIARLAHPNVVSVFDVGTYKSEVYIAMEFVEGATLTRWLRQWERPWLDVINKYRQAGRALAAAHAAGMVHRDFKPDNVLVGTDERVRVMDFGLARSMYESAQYGDGPFRRAASDSDVNSALGVTLTKTGSLLGTPRYMSPEQFRGDPPDARSDQFSFCVSLYESLYRQHPFEGDTAEMLLRSESAEVRPPPSSDVPEWLHRVLLRGLAKTPEERFPSMDVLLVATNPVTKPRHSNRWFAVAAGLGAVIVVLSLFLWRAVVQAQDAEGRTGELLEQRASVRKKLTASRKHAAVLQRKLDLRTETNEAEVKVLRQQLLATKTEIAKLEKQLGKPVAVKPRRAPRRPKLASLGLSRAAITRTVAPRIPDIRACFREWRDRKPRVVGALAIRFATNPDGTVAYARAVAGLSDKVLRLCVATLIRDLRFPATKALTVAAYEFLPNVTDLGTHRARIVDVSLPAATSATAAPQTPPELDAP